MPGNHIDDTLPNKNKKNIIGKKIFMKNRCVILGNHTRFIYDFLVNIQGS